MTQYALDRESVRGWDDAIAKLEDGAGGVLELLGAVEQLATPGKSGASDRRESLEVLGGDWDPVVRPLLVAGLLRILAARSDVLEPKDVRIPFFKALTSWAPDAVFKAAKVKSSEQTYKVETALQDTVVETLRRLTDAVGAPVAADTVRPYRTAVMKALRAPVAAGLIEPFLPLQAVTTRLDAAFQRVKSSSSHPGRKPLAIMSAL